MRTREARNGWLIAAALAGLGLLGSTPALAHTDPAGCTSPGVDIAIAAFRTADGTTPGAALTPGVSVVTECETILYVGRLAKSSAAAACAFQAGTITITTPDGVAQNVTPVGGVPCIGGTTAPCDPAVTEVFSQIATYTVDPADISGGTVTALIDYANGTLHAGVNDVLNVVFAGNANPQLVALCPEPTDCTLSVCDPAVLNPAGGLGACVSTPLDSNPCDTNNAGQPVVDIPGDCATPGCEAGECVATHIPQADSTPCTAAPDIPGDCQIPGCEAGVCVSDHTPQADSTPCTTTPDITGDCGDPGCEAGVCVATHIPEADSTPCNTTPDIPGDCADPGCEAGVCVATHIPDADSTPCTTAPDVPGDCQIPGCEAGVCVSDHTAQADSTPCTTAPDVPGDCQIPGCEAGICVSDHTAQADSTPCTTAPDITGDCGDPGCEAGVCVSTHVPETDSTPCTTTPDIAGDCGDPGCEAGVCVATHIPEADSIPCTTTPDIPGDCLLPGCEAGVCVPDHIEEADSTPCDTVEPLPGCEPGCQAGACVSDHVCENLICRTPGFWGTHGGTEKSRSQNITQAVIEDAGGCFEICGELIQDTLVDSADSALEAICVSPRGDQRLQLVRQLTAMALNCIVSGVGSDCGGAGSDLSTLFSECNSTCLGTGTVFSTGECIDQIDCFNNGGTFDTSCVIEPGNCHEQELPDPFSPPGPAGSSGACGDARQDTDCTVVPPGETDCASGEKLEAVETCP